MELVLQKLLHTDIDAIDTLAELIDELRPSSRRIHSVQATFDDLVLLLQQRSDYRDGLRAAILQIVAGRHAVLLFATSGIYPETGAYTEARRRISEKFLPAADDGIQLKYALARIFRRNDVIWLNTLSESTLVTLLKVLNFEEVAQHESLVSLHQDFIEALRIVAHRIAAAGLEPEMLRLDPNLEKHESPFLAVCEEVLDLIKDVIRQVNTDDEKVLDERHLLVLLDQARETIDRIRRRAQQLGASFYLTFRLKRLAQHLDRLERIVEIMVAHFHQENEKTNENIALFTKELLVAECTRNDLRNFWQENTELVALRVTENAGKSGDHYITTNRKEYVSMLVSASGGGIIIAFMAAFKIYLGTLGLPPLVEVLAFSLNYGLGFVLIHILGFTVATKQSAMTANAIAGAMGDVEDIRKHRQKDYESLVSIVVRTIRSQFIAIVGNVGLAIPMAILFAFLFQLSSGESFLTTTKATSLLVEIDPTTSGSIFFAFITGICLFLAGLIAGYYDNLCAYNRIPERLFQLRWVQKIIGQARWQRVTDYIADNLGALAGNFFFGFLLAGVSGLGVLLGLPLDIRHISFSSAYFGYSAITLDFYSNWHLLLSAAFGVMLIGTINLAVSFYLAIWVGLKSRRIAVAQRMLIGKAIGKRFLATPRAFFWPPKNVDEQ